MSTWTPHHWRLHCAWCPITIHVGPRGGHGKNQGAGVEAATIMETHVGCVHGKSWAEFLAAGRCTEPA